MTAISGSITIEGRKLEEAIADAVDRRVQAALRPVLDEVRRLAALAEAEMVGAPEAAKILVSSGATLDIERAVHVVANLARMGYRFTLVDPNAATLEVPIVRPSAEELAEADATAVINRLHTDGRDTAWMSQFE